MLEFAQGFSRVSGSARWRLLVLWSAVIQVVVWKVFEVWKSNFRLRLMPFFSPFLDFSEKSVHVNFVDFTSPSSIFNQDLSEIHLLWCFQLFGLCSKFKNAASLKHQVFFLDSKLLEKGFTIIAVTSLSMLARILFSKLFRANAATLLFIFKFRKLFSTDAQFFSVVP